MHELADYFDAIDPKVVRSFEKEEGFFGSIFLSETQSIDFEKAQIALIGLTDSRNSFIRQIASDPNTIRAAFYKLSAVNRVQIVDLGNLKNGKGVQDTYAALAFVTTFLLKKNIIPLVFGGTQDFTVPMVKALFSQQKLCEVLYVDAQFDISQDKDFHSKNYINSLIQDYKDTIQQSIVAYQTYYTTAQQQRFLTDNYIETIRLGTFRGNFLQVEPIFRDADIVSFDLSSIKHSDCSASTVPGPNGLYSEEACQLLNLAGLSDKLKAVGIFEYNSNADTNDQSVQLIAQLIWHFISGYSQRHGDWPARSVSKYKKIFVKIERTDTDLVFYQNTQNNRYWIEIPSSTKAHKRIISCSEKDYKDICNNDISDRIWKSLSRTLK